MKRFVIILMSLLLVLTGCGTQDDPSLGGQNTPGGSVGLFSNYVEKGDYESAKTFLTDDIRNVSNVKMEEIHNLFVEGKIFVPDFDKRKIIGDNAEVPVTLLDDSDGNDNVNYIFYLTKTDDGWLIQSISEY